jgi:hypothetical protein
MIDLEKMKHIMFSLVCVLSLFTSKSYAFDEINGNKVVLITSKEHEIAPEQADSITRQRAENACYLINKVLVDFKYKELEQDNIFDTCYRAGCVSRKDLEKYKIPTKNYLQAVNYKDMELHYHDGGAAVAVITLGLIPIIITYPARIATSITCGDKDSFNYTTN